MTNTVSAMVSDETLDSIIQIESGGRPTIQASTSSALGLGQFLNATWLNVVKDHRPDVMQGRSTAQVLAMRTDPAFSIEMLARFTEDNMNVVGANCSPGDLYLAHFLGSPTAKLFYRAPRSTSAVSLAGIKAAQANKSIFYRPDGTAKNAGEIRDWSAQKMAKAGGKGWVRKYYVSAPEPADVEAPPALEEFHGDEDLRKAQIDLESMNYNPGDIDGLWGGGTLGALGGFILDWRNHNFIPVPQSFDDFQANLDTIRTELDQAIAENFKRPIKQARKSEKVEDVAKIAPEVVPVQQGATWTLRGAIAAGVTFVGNQANNAWNWLAGNKDSLPTDPSSIHKAIGYVQAIPPGIWILAVGVGLGALWYFKLRPGVQQITKAVNTGKRL